MRHTMASGLTCLEMTSGASQRGLFAVMEVVFSSVSSTLDRLKSPIFTRQCLSTSRLGDFRSLWTMRLECSWSIPCRHKSDVRLRDASNDTNHTADRH